MATRAFDDWQVMPEARQSHSTHEPVKYQPLFSGPEFQVIWLARHDGVRSIIRPSRLSRFIGWLVGYKPENPLADPRLEAIRRFAVAVKAVDGSPPCSEYQLFYNAGFSALHADFIVQKMTERLSLSQR